MTGEEAHWAGLGPEDCEPLSPSPEIPESRADRLNRYLLNPHDHLLDKSPYGDLVMFTEAAAAIRVLEGKLRAAQTTTQSPEIRYQLRNWHHVTCAGFGGQACTCLAQREALIVELAGG